MPYLFAFEKLEVWQEMRKLVKEIYAITNSFPSDEKYGLVSQLRRAAVSVASNISEGSARNTAKDQANFYGMAYSSLMELYNQLIISKDIGWLNSEQFEKLRNDIEKISSMINAMRKSTLR